MKENKDLVAVVLCGGKSTRMGQDKGLIEEDGTQWARQMLLKLEKQGISTYISVNEMQIETYKKIFSVDKIIQDRMWNHVNGPLQGILTSHQAFPDKHILFLPCDMPRLDQDFFDLLFNAYQNEFPQYTFLIPQAGEQLQPLCGIYSKNGLDQLLTSYYQGELSDRSMISLFEANPEVYKLFLPEEMHKEFKNFNKPDDLEK